MSKSTSSYGNYQLFTSSLEKLPSLPKIVISTINQYSFCIAERESTFQNALIQSDVLLPDGVGILAAVKLQTGQTIKKISGSTLHSFLLNKLNKENGSCFYVGASEETLTKIKEKVGLEFPNVKVRFYSPPYKDSFTDKENLEIIRLVNEFSPNVLFVGMTAPKQEKWAIANKHLLNAEIISSIGAVFDFYAGTVKRPSSVWIQFGLEWLGRLLSEPRRMWKRYLYYGPIFIGLVLKYKYKNLLNLEMGGKS